MRISVFLVGDTAESKERAKEIPRMGLEVTVDP
jgi:hypothetical protein